MRTDRSRRRLCHMSVSVDGTLHHYKNTRKKSTPFEDNNGRRLTAKQVVAEMMLYKSQGKRVIPMSDECYRFDFQSGCKGHIISLNPSEQKQQEIEWNICIGKAKHKYQSNAPLPPSPEEQMKTEPRIKITCDGCGKVHDVRRTHEIPNNVISMGCNWCPDKNCYADSEYEEWYNYSDGDGSNTDPVPDNQMCLPFEIQNIEENSHEHKVHSRPEEVPQEQNTQV